MRKNKTKTLIKVVIAMIIVLAVAVAGIFYLKIQLDKYDIALTEAYDELDSKQKTVYVANRDISGGEILTEGDNVILQTISSNLEVENYVSLDELGSTCIVSIPAGTPIMDVMVKNEEITKDSRDYEISVVNLMTDQQENDYVDIRIMFPNGEDMVVLPKKKVENLNLESCVFNTHLNEEEIQRMASATIDAYSISGTYLYTTRYVEENIQDEAIPTYVVRQETLEVIHQSPNVLTNAQYTLNKEARENLEMRLFGLTEEQLAAVANGHDIEDTAKNSVLINPDANNSIEGTSESGSNTKTETITIN